MYIYIQLYVVEFQKSLLVTVWRKILTEESIDEFDEFDEFPTICQYFPFS